MNKAEKKSRKEQALRALAQHALDFKKEVDGDLLAFWTSDDVWDHEGKSVKASLPGWEGERTLRLQLAPPSWSRLSDDLFDDAVVGPRGDWKHAGGFSPLFAAEGGVFVAALEAPHAVGWFEEERWDAKGKGYKKGVFMVSPSLADFMKSLGKARRRSEDDDDNDDLWGDGDD